MARRDNNGESVFEIVRRLVQPVEVIAEMMRLGDADQTRLYGLAKLLLASLVDLAEGIDQSRTEGENGQMDEFSKAVEHIIYGLRDWLQAAATAIYDRKSNSQAMDVFSDLNATAVFISQNIFPYATNHEPTVREWQNKVNLDKVTEAARNQTPARVQALINALSNGLEGRDAD